MARTFNGTSQYLSATSSVLGSTPGAYTMACWVNGAATTGTYIFALGASSTNNPILSLVSNGSGQCNHFVRNDAGTTICAINTGVGLDSTWHHIYASYSGSGMKTGVDGSVVNGGGPTGTITLDRLGIGALVRAAVSAYWAGTSAEPAIWNVQLSDVEILSLARGASPRRIRPQSLRFYAPIGREVIDIKGGLAITDNGPSTVATHPRIYA